MKIDFIGILGYFYSTLYCQYFVLPIPYFSIQNKFYCHTGLFFSTLFCKYFALPLPHTFDWKYRFYWHTEPYTVGKFILFTPYTFNRKIGFSCCTGLFLLHIKLWTFNNFHTLYFQLKIDFIGILGYFYSTLYYWKMYTFYTLYFQSKNRFFMLHWVIFTAYYTVNILYFLPLYFQSKIGF